jgi:hypothetical protein
VSAWPHEAQKPSRESLVLFHRPVGLHDEHATHAFSASGDGAAKLQTHPLTIESSQPGQRQLVSFTAGSPLR